MAKVRGLAPDERGRADHQSGSTRDTQGPRAQSTSWFSALSCDGYQTAVIVAQVGVLPQTW
jgi:hypothetical protein